MLLPSHASRSQTYKNQSQAIIPPQTQDFLLGEEDLTTILGKKTYSLRPTSKCLCILFYDLLVAQDLDVFSHIMLERMALITAASTAVGTSKHSTTYILHTNIMSKKL